MSVAEFSVKRPITTVMFFVSLFVIGLIAAVRLPLEAFPSITAPFVFVQMPYSGSTPEEVERTVLRPAEEALSTMAGIKRIGGNARAEGACQPRADLGTMERLHRWHVRTDSGRILCDK